MSELPLAFEELPMSDNKIGFDFLEPSEKSSVSTQPMDHIGLDGFLLHGQSIDFAVKHGLAFQYFFEDANLEDVEAHNLGAAFAAYQQGGRFQSLAFKEMLEAAQKKMENESQDTAGPIFEETESEWDRIYFQNLDALDEMSPETSMKNSNGSKVGTNKREQEDMSPFQKVLDQECASQEFHHEDVFLATPGLGDDGFGASQL